MTSARAGPDTEEFSNTGYYQLTPVTAELLGSFQ